MVDLEHLRSEVRSLQLDCQRMYQELDDRSAAGTSQPQHQHPCAVSVGNGPVAARPVIPSTAEEEEDSAGWNCSTCTFRNHPALVKCEECETPRPLIMGHRSSSHAIPTPTSTGTQSCNSLSYSNIFGAYFFIVINHNNIFNGRCLYNYLSALFYLFGYI